MGGKLRCAWLAAAAWLLLPPAQAQPDCAASGGVEPLCGWQRPEDLEVLPGGRLLLVSEYGGLDGAMSGRLATLAAGSGTRTVLYPGGASGDGWGDPACGPEPAARFAPHGIHVDDSDGVLRVLAVNHGLRESVELFELAVDDVGAARLTWRGCVEAPADTWLNDVVGLPGGGFAVSHMVQRGTAEAALEAAEQSQAATGDVRTWAPSAGWSAQAGSAGALPNGLEISADHAILYVNYYFGDRVVALERASGRRLWETAVPAPDNSAWSADGRLLVTSHDEPLSAVMACSGDYCGLRYGILALDAATGRAERIAEGGGAPFGAATVAVEFDGHLYLGSYTGTRMARMALPR